MTADSLPPGPWTYRPEPMDDWGWVRDAEGNIVADTCSSLLSEQFREEMSIQEAGVDISYGEWRARNHAGPPQARAVAELLIEAAAEADETPTTHQWLVESGFCLQGCIGKDVAILADIEIAEFTGWYCFLRISIPAMEAQVCHCQAGMNESDGMALPKTPVATRGQVRTLCRALGITLTENQPHANP